MLTRLTALFLVILTQLGFLPQFYYGKESKQLFADTVFSEGFTVVSQDTSNGTLPLGDFVYSDSAEPRWMIAQWNSGGCLWANRIEGDRFTLTDGVTKTVTYNPDDRSVSMRLNAAAVYGGKPAGDGAWPHLLLEQSLAGDYSAADENGKAFYRCDSDKLIFALDVRISDFCDTLNPEGINAVQYQAFVYLSGVDGDKFVWFGIPVFDSRGECETYWSRDTAGSNNMIYTVSTADTYGTKLRSLNPFGTPRVGQRWTRICVDLTPHIEKMIERANADNIFGKPVSAEDFYISGTNIGFEIHGNYDCRVDIKNYTLTSYR